jgi:hypothetical protein
MLGVKRSARSTGRYHLPGYPRRIASENARPARCQAGHTADSANTAKLLLSSACMVILCTSSCSWLCDLALLGELGELGVSLEPRFPPVVSDLLGDCRSARAAEGLKGQHAVPAGLYARSHGTGWGGEGQGEEGESLDRGKLGQAWVAAGSVKMRRHARFQRHGMHPSTRP